uniref:Mille-patte n=1 Tax=Gerris buenoi TaxID=56086 RepID=A0A482JQV4_GERBU|nr:mille-patte [Gerris buenoi]
MSTPKTLDPTGLY